MRNAPARYRLGAVSFLNTIPLIDWFYGPENSRVEVVRDLPSRLSGLLADGTVDVALLPVVEIFRGKSGGMLSGTGIAGFGEVDSVKLLTAAPWDQTIRVQADRGSRSSVALLRILFREYFGTSPEFRESEPLVGQLPERGEGILVIGDRCFQFDHFLRETPRPGFQFQDLGRLWTNLTGLPFVFAAWAVSADFEEKFGPEGVAEMKDLLARARDHGLARLDLLARREAESGKLGFHGEATTEAIDYYFRKSLRYKIGDEEMTGLLRFEELCTRHQILDTPSALKIL